MENDITCTKVIFLVQDSPLAVNNLLREFKYVFKLSLLFIPFLCWKFDYLCHGISFHTVGLHSSRAIDRERDMLSHQLLKKYRTKQREVLYEKWGIELNSKQRRKQLSRKLWKDTEDLDHVKASASLVAKLVGDPNQAPKETFGLSFAPQHGSFALPSLRKSTCGPY